MSKTCMYIDPYQNTEKHGGYLPVLVTEGDAVRAEISPPGTWPPLPRTLEDAEKRCDAYNREVYGLSKLDCVKIVMSSMLAGQKPRVSMHEKKERVREMLESRGDVANDNTIAAECDVSVSMVRAVRNEISQGVE